ncbi:cytochrome P450 monooxigenase [Microsporum canis CBS 113480]|uniref:Cytochrome P450 monooxigenase n=1 Tax=Arthroderma otae (strain ATCC MYA-4605 / CBS 113480) TaxID=554155 RepID=C5G0I1_ARTOC|nr:cytochrome P450 monooxigenase [Microsporum canis CBS 113480]EEQ35634.1 cytochrome P450 monooxigenase [Microsporum canis CBS 113480]
MNFTRQSFISLVYPGPGDMEGLDNALRSFIQFLGVGLFTLAFFLWRNGNQIKCIDIDGVQMKEMSVSRQGEELAHDEPYLIRDGNYQEVVLHTAEHIIFGQRTWALVITSTDNLGESVLGQCVGAVSGEQWRVIRSYFDTAYTNSASLAMLPSFQCEVSKWLSALKNDSLRSGVGRLVVHAPTSCKSLTLRVIPRSFYGEAYNEAAHGKLNHISKLQAQVLRYAITDGINNSGRACIQRRAAKQCNVYGAADLSLVQYLQTIDEMLFTNIEVTGSILAYIFSQLAKHQDFQQRLYDEVLASKSAGELYLRGYLGQQNTLLHYLTLESVRLRPATCKGFSASFHHRSDMIADQDAPQGSQRQNIPAKTPIVIDVRRLNTSAMTWGPDGTKFRPERFAALSPNQYRYGFMRFGVVSGKCLGKHMAELLMKVAIVTVLEQYKIGEMEVCIGVKQGDLAFIRR